MFPRFLFLSKSPRSVVGETSQSNCLSCFCFRLDNIRCLFGDGDDWSCGMTADLIREDGRVDDAETLDAEYA